ncbi:MAG TPA: 2-hydroxychromene-2-carboxylate isomerase [Kiloniellales bacterium]
MHKHIDYYFSLISPFTYLGSAHFEEIARRHGAEVAVKPVNLGVIFPKSGGLPLAKRSPERQAYRLMELERWRSYLDMPLNLKPKHFPAPEQQAACLVIAAARSGGDPLRLAHAILRAVWAEERNIADADTLQAIARETGHDDRNLMRAAQDPETLKTYEAYTAEAMSRGVFGAPTYVIDGELFWGQDRLDFVDRALSR